MASLDTWAQLLPSVWDLLRLGIKPLSPALTGGFFTISHQGSLIVSSLLKQGFATLCPCHDYYCKVLTRDKHWLFTLFLLLLPFRRANRRLIVNALTGAHLALV